MSTLVRRRRVVRPVPVGASLALALTMATIGATTMTGCGKPKEPVVAPGGSGGGTPVAPAEPLPPVEHPSQMMPRDTSVLVVGSSITRAAEVFERDRLVKAFGPQYTSLRSVITGTLGYDLLDPAQWRDAGLDPDGPAGLAVSDLVTARMVLFATIADRTKVVELVRRVAGKAEVEIVEQQYGPHASVLRAKGEGGGAVVLRDQWVALVLDDGAQNVDLAERLVTMDPNVSLAAQVGYRKATGGMRAADLTVYFDLAGMVDHANMEAEAHTAKPERNWAEEELAQAKKDGAPPERIAELERQAQEQQQWQEQWQRRAEGERALFELLVSGIEGVGFSTTVKRSGPAFDGRVVAEPEAFMRRLLDNREGAPALPVAMNGAPLWCGSGHMERGAALELLEAVAAAEGKDTPAFLAEAKAAMGLDLQVDLVPVMQGDAELCVALEGSLEEVPTDPREALGLGAIVAVSDQAKAKYLLAKMATSGSELGTRMRKQGDGYTVEVPDWKTMHLQPVGDRIVVSTDPELAKRLASGDPGSMPSKIRPPGARGALELPGTAASQAFDLSTGVLWLLVGRAMDTGEPMVLAPGLSPEEMAKVPRSARTKKARKALDAARADVERLEAKREQLQMKQALAMTDGLGILVGALTEDDRGFVLSGGQFLRAPSMGAVIESLLAGAMGERPSLSPAEEEALAEAWERNGKAQQEFIESLLADAEKWKKKQGR